jgi:hypothetical protein
MAKKSLIPCDFITTKGGKEVRLSYDQMRQFLFDNPEIWMSSSSRKIGVGKATPAQQVAALRKQEQAEYDAMSDPKDKAKRQEIYNRYDKLISPLLAEDKAQASLGGRPTVGQISWTKSPEGKGDPSISQRNPIIQKAAQDYRDGKISQDEFGEIIDENRRIEPITIFYEPATEDEVINAVSANKKDKVGVALRNVELSSSNVTQTSVLPFILDILIALAGVGCVYLLLSGKASRIMGIFRPSNTI